MKNIDDITLNSTTKVSLDAVVNELPQSLLITGPSGVGLTTIAKFISNQVEAQIASLAPEKNNKIDLIDGSITVEMIRDLYIDASKKSLTKQLIIIDKVEKMTAQAQNAFLKLLEEPGGKIHFILISTSLSNILPTIISRVSLLNVKPITDKQTDEFLDKLAVTDTDKRTQIKFMASGLPAEITRLVSDETYFKDKSQIIRDAREFLTGKLYQKLLTINRYQASRSKTVNLIDAMLKILDRTTRNKPQVDILTTINKLLDVRDRVETSGNVRMSLISVIL